MQPRSYYDLPPQDAHPLNSKFGCILPSAATWLLEGEVFMFILFSMFVLAPGNSMGALV
ncbi:hypothetical protein LY76DRAFT_586867 [Colletotrichum caudatum]|nr:hypothetical protein LY76DRAFT_586867 [Colletotrichum caudatum]